MPKTSPPNGVGMFLWQLHRCEGGSIDAIVEKCTRSGITWLIQHEFCSAELISKAHLNGIAVYSCLYSVPGVTETQRLITRAHAYSQQGIDGLCVDAEEYWERRADGSGPGYRGPEAEVFASNLRAALPDLWIGNAGAWQWPRAHPLYPDREFARHLDAALPERYWTEFSPATPFTSSQAESLREWSTYPDVQGYGEVIPIGAAYGTNTPVPGGHQELSPADLRTFLQQDRCALWSWLHCPDWGWSLLEELANSKANAKRMDSGCA